MLTRTEKHKNTFALLNANCLTTCPPTFCALSKETEKKRGIERKYLYSRAESREGSSKGIQVMKTNKCVLNGWTKLSKEIASHQPSHASLVVFKALCHIQTQSGWRGTIREGGRERNAGIIVTLNLFVSLDVVCGGDWPKRQSSFLLAE